MTKFSAMNGKLTNKEYWEEHFGERKAFLTYQESNYSKNLHKYIDIDPNKSCVEIGAYPGENLGYVAKNFKYSPTAIDFIDDIFFIDENMKRNGINNCKIILMTSNHPFYQLKSSWGERGARRFALDSGLNFAPCRRLPSFRVVAAPGRGRTVGARGTK